MDRVKFLDLSVQVASIRQELDEAMSRVVGRAEFVLGEELEAFEAEFAAYCGTHHCVGVGSGTDALTLILRALDIGPGDEVITVPNTFVATALAIANVGADPVFCDIDPHSRNIDLSEAAVRVTARTRAIIPVHLYGLPADMDPLRRMAEVNGLHLIEDACQAHGATYRGRRAGALGDAAAFSFYPGKNLGAFGEGGAITTDSDEIARRARILRNVGQDRKYNHVAKGYNSRLDNLQAAVLRVKLRHLDGWNAARARHAEVYDALLGRHGIGLPATSRDRSSAHHIFAVEVDERDEIQKRLRLAGVETSIHYPIPIHLQAAFAELDHKPGDFPHAEESARRVLSLPMYAELTETQLRRVVASLVAAYHRVELPAAV